MAAASFLALPAVRRLAGEKAYRTSDLDAACAHIGSLFQSHVLQPVGRGRAADVCIGGRELPGMALFYHRHGAHVTVRPNELEGFFLLQIPLRGQARVRHGGEEIICDNSRAVMLSPGKSIDMEFLPDCEQLIVRLSASYLAQFLERQRLEVSPRHGLCFDASVPLSGAAGRDLLAALAYLVGAVAGENAAAPPAFLAESMSSLLLGTMLTCLPHSGQQAVWRSGAAPPPLAPHYVKRALRYIEEFYASPISPEDIAGAANVSLRSLFGAFQHYLGITPMRYLRNLRLDKARELLQSGAGDAASVTLVASQLGFAHLGRFAAEYKARFGQSPSAALKQRL